MVTSQKATGIVTVLKADVSDISSIDKMVKDCKVLINCVGPFAMYADPVVHSCVENHTDYLDITGEPNFLYDVIHKYHDKAVQNETLVIPAAAFDSVPGTQELPPINSLSISCASLKILPKITKFPLIKQVYPRNYSY